MKKASPYIFFFSILLLFPVWSIGQCTLPPGFLGSQQIACGAHTLGPVQGLSNYVWNSSFADTFPTLTVQNTGRYWLDGLDSLGNFCTDTVIVYVQPLPVVNLSPDLYFCGENEIDLCACVSNPWGGTPPNLYFHYFDSSNNKFVPLPHGDCRFWIDSTTTFWVDVENSNSGCRAGDTFTVFFDETMMLLPIIYPDFGGRNGAVKVDVIGGQPPFEFSWDWGTNWGNADSLYGFPGGYNGRVYVRDSTACTSIAKFNIPRETAVYPGDCNHDGTVDMCDIFPIGLHFGENGLVRPHASLDWKPQASPFWNKSQLSGKDLRHIDTDGNGNIGWSDTSAIIQNYDSTHNHKIPVPIRSGVPLYVELNKQNYQAGDTVFASVIIGKPDTMIFDLLGIVFSLNLDTNWVDISTVQVNAKSNWLGNHGFDLLQLIRENDLAGQYEWGLVKIDTSTKTGFGKLAALSFVLKNIPISREIPLLFDLNEVKAIDHLGEDIGLSPQPGIAMMRATTSNTDEMLDFINVYPNPTNRTIEISHPQKFLFDISVYNGYGQKLRIQPNSMEGRTQIDFSAFTPGIYWLEGKTEKNIFRKRILLIP